MVGLTLDIESTYQKDEKIKKEFLKKHYLKCVAQEKTFRENNRILELETGIVNTHPKLSGDNEPDITPDFIYIKYSPLYPEYGKILCISYILGNDKVKTIVGEDEKAVLKEFFKILEDPKIFIIGFNIKGFDIPYIIRRALIHDLTLPNCLRILGKKPWEVTMVDICDDYKFGMRDMISLDAICLAFGIPTSKDLFANHEMNTLLSMGIITVKDVVIYCEKDVNATQIVYNRVYSKF